MSSAWLVKYFRDLKKRNGGHATDEKVAEAFESMFNIMVASKMSLFKCRDLMEIATGGEVAHQTK